MQYNGMQSVLTLILQLTFTIITFRAIQSFRDVFSPSTTRLTSYDRSACDYHWLRLWIVFCGVLYGSTWIAKYGALKKEGLDD